MAKPYIYRRYSEAAWWLHAILVVVWGWNVVVGGWADFWHSRSEMGDISGFLPQTITPISP